MPSVRTCVLCLAWLACAVPLPAPGAEELSFAVLDLVSEGSATREQNEALVDRLVNEIQALGDFRVIGGSTIRSMLKLEENKALLGCNDDACMAEIGGALGVSYLVRGNISRFGDRYLVSLQVLDTRKVLVSGGVSQEITGQLEDLLSAIPPLVRRMFHDLAPQLGLGPEWAAGLLAVERRFELEGHALLFGGMWRGSPRALSGELDAQGDMNGERLGGGLRFAVRLGALHAIWLGLDYLREAWRGEAPCAAPDCDPSLSDRLSIAVSLDELRVLVGYRFAYPVLTWLEPYAELGLGVHVSLPRSLELPGGARSVSIQPEDGTRFSLTLGLGLRFVILERAFLHGGYQWESPLFGLSSSAWLAGAGVLF